MTEPAILAMAKETQDMAGQQCQRTPTSLTSRRRNRLLRDLRQDVDELETAMSVSQMDPVATALVQLGSTLGQVTNESGMGTTYAKLVEQVKLGDRNLVYESEGSALRAADEVRGSKVVATSRVGGRRWVVVDEEGNLVRPKGWKKPDLRPLLEERMKGEVLNRASCSSRAAGATTPGTSTGMEDIEIYPEFDGELLEVARAVHQRDMRRATSGSNQAAWCCSRARICSQTLASGVTRDAQAYLGRDPRIRRSGGTA